MTDPEPGVPDQRWFWSDEWQNGEREADDDIRNDRVTRYWTAEEFIDSLRRAP